MKKQLLFAIALLGMSMGVNAQTDITNSFRPLTQEMLNNPDPQDWLMWRGGYENWGSGITYPDVMLLNQQG